MSVVTIHKEEELVPIAEEILSVLPQKKNAHVITLTGDLGTGKTAFVKTLAKLLGITEHVTSPTFVIMKKYAVPNREQVEWVNELVHIDAYRIEDPDEMRVLKLDELYQKEGSIICIEWPEHIGELIPEDAYKMALALDPDGSRKMRYGEHGN